VNGRNFGPLLSYMPKVYSSLCFFMFVFSQINRNNKRKMVFDTIMMEALACTN
jgi:hypothetical protein